MMARTLVKKAEAKPDQDEADGSKEEEKGGKDDRREGKEEHAEKLRGMRAAKVREVETEYLERLRAARQQYYETRKQAQANKRCDPVLLNSSLCH